MRQLNNKHFDTIEGASARQGEVVSSASSPLVSQQKDEKMTYSEFVEEVQSELEYKGIEVDTDFIRIGEKIQDYCNSGLIGDPDAECDDEEFDEGDVDSAVDMIDTEQGGK